MMDKLFGTSEGLDLGAHLMSQERPIRSHSLPQPNNTPEWRAEPDDIDYCGEPSLEIDATDMHRGIVSAKLVLPVATNGPMTLLYPKWMPGYHSPQNPIELFAGLQIKAGDLVLDRKRDPVEVYAFHIDVPEGAMSLDISFQFLSPTTSTQGDVVVTENMINLQWGRILLYPAGYYTRCIKVRPSLTVPAGWHHATVLKAERKDGNTVSFAPVSLDVLVGSPVMAGRYCREVGLARTAQSPGICSRIRPKTLRS